MALGIIDVLEVIQIQHQQIEAGTQPLADFTKAAADLLCQSNTIGQLGQGIMVGQMIDTLLGLFALGNIDGGAFDMQCFAIGITHQSQILQYPHGAAIAAVYLHLIPYHVLVAQHLSQQLFALLRFDVQLIAQVGVVANAGRR